MYMQVNADLPVVPAGVISLKCWTTSSLFESLAFLAKQRISVLVSRSGFSREAWSSCMVSLRWRTTSLASHDWDKRNFSSSPGRAIFFLSKTYLQKWDNHIRPSKELVRFDGDIVMYLNLLLKYYIIKKGRSFFPPNLQSENKKKRLQYFRRKLEKNAEWFMAPVLEHNKTSVVLPLTNIRELSVGMWNKRRDYYTLPSL